MRKRMAYRRITFLLSGVFGILPLIAKSADTANVTIKVTVLAKPSCKLNNNNPINVDFGDVTTNKIDGSNYIKSLVYSLNCENGASGSMTLSINGNPSSFDPSALTTSVAGLAIRLKNNAATLALNTGSATFTYPTDALPSLFAVPIKRSGVSLSAGAFTASATMTLDYPRWGS